MTRDYTDKQIEDGAEDGDVQKEDRKMSNTKSTPFHVYAIDGFESAHVSAEAAIRAAKRGAKRRGVLYTVVRCDLSGYTGAGNGTEVWVSNGSVTRS